MFNKLIRGLKKAEKKRLEEQEIRIKSIMNEVGEIFKNRGVTVVEMNDMLLHWLKVNNAQLIALNQQTNAELDKLIKEKNDRLQPKEDRR